MRTIYKAILALLVVCIAYTFLTYFPVISASFDDAKYVDGEVFASDNGEFDFRRFTLNCPQAKNYTTIIDKSGFAQFVDNNWNYTINVFEWDKMTPASRERLNSSFMLEFEKPNRTVDGICIIEGEFLSDRYYSTCVNDPNSNVQVYIASFSLNDTVELAKGLEFRGH